MVTELSVHRNAWFPQLFLLASISPGNLFTCAHLGVTTWYHLVGLVVKASASRVEDPGFESCLHRDFAGVESYQ